jgi:CBS domain containing-hemolysin-like protein
MEYLLDVLQLLGVPLLVLLNGYFVATEFALVTIRWTRVEQLVEERKFGATAVQHAVENLDDAIAATQLGITFASLALGWIGEPALAHLIEPMFAWLPGWIGVAATHAVAVTIAFMIITFLHVVLGELAPKVIALQCAEDVALIVAGPLLVFSRVFRPFIHFMNGAGNWVVRQLRLPPLPTHKSVHSIDELMLLVEETEEAGVIPGDQADYLENVFTLSEKKVREVMVPREKVVGLPMNATEDEVLEVARRHAHTRMPIWDGEPDNIVGIVNTKDLFHLFSLRGLVVLMDAMYPALFVSPDDSVAKLLATLRRDRRHLAIVRSEDGRFLGIVTLEDILEEIVGEIEDEHDVPRRAADLRSRRMAITRQRLLSRARRRLARLPVAGNRVTTGPDPAAPAREQGAAPPADATPAVPDAPAPTAGGARAD